MGKVERSKKVNFSQETEDSINPDNLRFLRRYEVALGNAGKSKATIYNYERDLINWLCYVNEYQDNMHVKDIEMEDVEDFVFFCREHGNNNKRIQRRLSSISAFYEKFLMVRGYVDKNPVDNIERPKDGLPVESKIFLTKAQVESIREELELVNDTQLKLYFEFSIFVCIIIF